MTTSPRDALAVAAVATTLGQAVTSIGEAIRAAGTATAPTREPRIIDCTRYDYAFTPRDNGQAGNIACWTVPSGGKPRDGDWLILRNGDRSSRYRVTKVDICWNVDPPTMWMADLAFDPRRADPGREALP